VTSDHTQVLSRLRSLASQLHVTLPTTVNATQMAEAQALMSNSGTTVDILYSQKEITGHETSIAQTQTELSSGSDQAVVQFAQYYLPIAQNHLHLFESNVSALGASGSGASASATPSGVNAGSGGMAAPHDGSSVPLDVGLGVAGMALVGLSGRRLARRRTVA